MSLFEETGYQYRETCFVLFSRDDCPSSEEVTKALRSLGERYELADSVSGGDPGFDAICVRCPYDHSAMDISFVEGDDVVEQVAELLSEFPLSTATKEDQQKLEKLKTCDARFDLFHFEELLPGEDSNDDFMDPGALLVVLQTLARLTKGVGVDAQSGTLI